MSYFFPCLDKGQVSEFGFEAAFVRGGPFLNPLLR